jgi:hypothetical protein
MNRQFTEYDSRLKLIEEIYKKLDEEIKIFEKSENEYFEGYTDGLKESKNIIKPLLKRFL